MNPEKIRWLIRTIESLNEACAFLDCIEPATSPQPEDELIEAVMVDANRACDALAGLLRQHGALPSWAGGDAPGTHPGHVIRDEEIPF